MSWLQSHAIDHQLAKACGVQGVPAGEIYFRYDRGVFTRVRKPDGSVRQPKGERLRLYWPVGDDASTVLLCEGEGDTLAAASVLCEVKPQGGNLSAAVVPRAGLPAPLEGLCPVGLPGTTTPLRTVVGEFISAGVQQAFICLDGPLDCEACPDGEKCCKHPKDCVLAPQDRAGREGTIKIGAALTAHGIKVVPVHLAPGRDLADTLAAIEPDRRADVLASKLADAEAATE